VVIENKKGRREGGLCEKRVGDRSGLHDVPTGRAVFDEALAPLGFCGAILGRRHAAASGFLGHGIFSLWLDCGRLVSSHIMPAPASASYEV
jgi:hypothetical protein